MVANQDELQNLVHPFFEWSPVRAFAPSFGPVPTKSGSKKMRQHIFLEGAKVAALPLRPPPGLEAKGMWWRELRFTILCLVYVSRKSSSHSRRLSFSYFFLWKKKYQKKPLENDYGRFPEQLCGSFVLLWLRLQFSTRGNSWISCKAGLMADPRNSVPCFWWVSQILVCLVAANQNELQNLVHPFFEWSPVRAFAPSFGPVPT